MAETGGMAPDFTSERLRYHVPAGRHAADIAAGLGEWDVVRMTGRPPHSYTRADADAFIEQARAGRESGDAWNYVFEDSEGGFKGVVGLYRDTRHYELGFWLAKPAWGQGFGTEAGRAMLAFGRNSLEADAFTAGHYTDNPASGRLLEKFGFQTEGIVQFECMSRGAWVEARRYRLGGRPGLSMTSNIFTMRPA